MTERTVKKRGRGRPPLAAENGPSDIKRAAIAEFARHGFKGASIDQIAARAGVAKRLVHYHFGSKDALWRQAVGEEYDAFQAEALTFADGLATQPAQDALDALADQLVRFAATRVALLQISMDETRQGGERAAWLSSTYLVPLQRMMIDHASGLLGSRPDAKALAAHLIPSIFGAAVFPFVDAEVTGQAHGLDVFSETYIEGQATFIKHLLRATLDVYGA